MGIEFKKQKSFYFNSFLDNYNLVLFARSIKKINKMDWTIRLENY